MRLGRNVALGQSLGGRLPSSHCLPKSSEAVEASLHRFGFRCRTAQDQSSREIMKIRRMYQNSRATEANSSRLAETYWSVP